MEPEEKFRKYLSEENYMFESERGVKNLCKIAEDIGYRDPFRQLIYDNGACAGSLLYMLSDNPGLQQVMVEWIEDNMNDDWADYLVVEDDESEEE